ncbi:MAG: S8 family serine peptidase [Gaiellaceae bacterium]
MRALALLIAIAAASLLAAAAPADGADVASVVVVLKGDVGSARVADEHVRAHGVAVTHLYGTALSGYAARVPSGRLEVLRRDPRVAYVAPDLLAHVLGQPAGSPQTLPTGIRRTEGDRSSARSGDGSGAVAAPAVAILDTGIDRKHPDLNVAGVVNCVGGKNGDGYGHGTKVAGIVAARDNGIGAVGIAPGAPVYDVKVINDSGTASLSSVICGIDWVSANTASRGIRVANMSFGFRDARAYPDDGNCGITVGDPFHQAVCNSSARGITYVASAGNTARDLAVQTPASYDEVLTVTALADYDGLPGGLSAPTCQYGADDTPASFSSYAVSEPDAAHTVAAPGTCTYTTARGGYAAFSGTSAASPHVAGMVALCLAGGRCAGTPAQTVQQIRLDAAAHSTAFPAYGFSGDARSHVPGSSYYGYLAWAGGY